MAKTTEHPPAGTVLGYVFPKQTLCPSCGCQGFTRCGSKARVQYRRCEKRTCRRVYKVVAIGAHIAKGDGTSRLDLTTS